MPNAHPVECVDHLERAVWLPPFVGQRIEALDLHRVGCPRRGGRARSDILAQHATGGSSERDLTRSPSAGLGTNHIKGRQSILSSPTPVAAIPSVEEVSEMVISEARDLTKDWQPQYPAQPEIARRAPPDFDRTVSAHVELIVRIYAIEAPPHVLDPSAEASQRIRLEVDVAKLNYA